MNALIAALVAGGMAVYPLLLLAVIAVVVILDKVVLYARRTALPRDLMQLIEHDGCDWASLDQRVAALGKQHYVGQFLRIILAARGRPAWWIESRAADAAVVIDASLGRWLWVLETIVTAAPLLGLLGTIAGMVQAFNLFGASGLVDPGGVTGGVAEALIATAVGLFIALLALFAFNFFSQRQARLIDEMERLGTRLVDRVRLEQEGSIS